MGIAIGVLTAIVALILILIFSGHLSMPDLSKLTQEEVESTLQEYEITPVFEYSYDDDVPRGRVISQSPQVSEKIEKGQSGVKVTVSLGSETIEMPLVEGMSYERAMELIQQNELRIGSVDYRVDSSHPKDTVIEQFPKKGETIRRGESVKLWLSRP